jgi:hypothetical protein
MISSKQQVLHAVSGRTFSKEITVSFIKPWCPETATALPPRRPWSPRYHLPTRSGPLPCNRRLRHPCWSSLQQQVGQHCLPLDFYSKKLSKTEINYLMFFDREPLTVIACSKPICSRLENRTLPVVDRPQTAAVRSHQGEGDNTTPAQACEPTGCSSGVMMDISRLTTSRSSTAPTPSCGGPCSTSKNGQGAKNTPAEALK